MSVATFKQVDGRNVIASDTAETLGKVMGFVFDARGRTIEAIHVAGHGKRATLLEWSAVTAFGADAVMTSSARDLSTVDDEHQRAAVAGDRAMIDARVLTIDGWSIGTVDDVEFETDSGAIVRVVTDQGPIEADRLRAVGTYALIVAPAAPAAPAAPDAPAPGA